MLCFLVKDTGKVMAINLKGIEMELELVYNANLSFLLHFYGGTHL